MTTQHVETLVIGAGQAGLAVGYHLQRRGRPFLIVDRAARIGDAWRAHYDSLRLYSPAKFNSLPGLRFPARDPWSYPGKDAFAEYLEQYAVTFDLPARMCTGVDRLTARPGGGYLAVLGEDAITCSNVVVATGTYGRTPAVPSITGVLDPSIRQLHSSRYRNPSQLRDGAVLVVGASHSGTDIAYELAADRPTTLVGRDCGQIPVRWDSPAMRVVFPVLSFAWRHVLTRRNPLGRKAMAHVRAHGHPMLRVKRADLHRRGVHRHLSRVTGATGGLPTLADGTVLDVQNIIWCTGFRQEFDWIEAPVIGADGWPDEYRGVVAGAPGLFFCGLSFQFAFTSMMVPGIGRDAEFVARRIAARAGSELLAQPA